LIFLKKNFWFGVETGGVRGVFLNKKEKKVGKIPLKY